jgi:ABC-type oligopeptide transport system ATPase subunit
MNNRNPLVKVRHLKKYFSVSNGGFGKKPVDLKAVDDVSFSIDRGHTFVLV